MYAVLVSAVGISRHETFPATQGQFRAAIGIAVLLVAGTMASAILTG